MPILGPSGPIFTINDLVNEVILRCENRVSDTARAAVWLRDAILEITGNPDFRNEFDDLEVVGPTFALSAGVQEYPFSNFITSGDYNMSTLDVFLWSDPGTNLNRLKLNPSHYQEADKQPTLTQAQPTDWYRFGDNLGFTPVPNNSYQSQIRLYRMHPIAESDPAQTQLYIPRDWHEILVWAAVERGFMELLEYEKSAQIHQLLHGDPKHPDRPGLYDGRKKRREREAWRQQQALRPIVRGSSYGAQGRGF